jgi:RNA polymerase sigma-70 factor (ECF subfamily)
MPDRFEEDLIALLPNLRRYAITLCRDPHTADDLVQITAERAFSARATLDPAARVDAWLFRILRNAWIDMTRRTRTRGETVDIDDTPEAATVDGRSVTETRLMLASATAAIATLPENQREVLMLVCVEEFSYAEAAELLGVPQGTVMSRLSRARSAVIKMLGIE